MPPGPVERRGRQVVVDPEVGGAGDVPGLEERARGRGASPGHPADVGHHEIARIQVRFEPGSVDERSGQLGHASLRVSTTGAWSLGLPSPLVGLRSSRSTVTETSRSATGAEPSSRSIRSPHPRWKAPIR